MRRRIITGRVFFSRQKENMIRGKTRIPKPKLTEQKTIIQTFSVLLIEGSLASVPQVFQCTAEITIPVRLIGRLKIKNNIKYMRIYLLKFWSLKAIVFMNSVVEICVGTNLWKIIDSFLLEKSCALFKMSQWGKITLWDAAADGTVSIYCWVFQKISFLLKQGSWFFVSIFAQKEIWSL